MRATVDCVLNGRWPLRLLPHRAASPVWTGRDGWERKRLDSMHANLQPGDVVFDIGAEEGDLSALYASWGCDVVLVEPNPAVWPNIRATFDANGLIKRLVATWVGFAGNEEQTRYDPGLAFYPFHHFDGWPTCARGPIITDHGFCNIGERPDLPVTTVDRLAEVARRSPAALTIDVEGAELAVLQGAERTLREHRPIVWVSIHPTFMAEMYGQSGDQVLDLMAGHGYRHELLGIDHEVHVVFHHPAGRVHIRP